jgi:hypothetical protein
MFTEDKTIGSLDGWRRGGVRVLLITFSVVAVNAVSALVARTYAAMQDLGRENRERREWYALYRDVMANQDTSQSWKATAGDPVSGLRIADLKDAVRHVERRQLLAQRS